jgi:hypothetical protein
MKENDEPIFVQLARPPGLHLIDVETGGVVLEVGTSYSDSYYPSCVMNFNPENLVHNAHLKTAPAGSR